MNPEITAENIKQWLPGTFPGDMAIEPVEITDEVATGRMVVDKRHLHPGGFVHGGVWTAFGDSVAAWATFRALPPNHDFTTIELKLNVFAAGVLGDEMICEARPLHVGRSTAVIEAKIRKEAHQTGSSSPRSEDPHPRQPDRHPVRAARPRDPRGGATPGSRRLLRPRRLGDR